MPDDGSKKLVSVDSIPDVPDWVYNPTRKINRVITNYLIGLVAAFIGYTTGLIDQMFGIFTDALDSAGGGLVDAGAAVASPILGTIDLLGSAVFEAAGMLGPLGPPFLALVAGVTVVVIIRLIRAVMDSVPVLSGIQTFFERDSK